MKQDKYLWTVKVSDKGQISIPKQAREIFGIETGDTLVLLGDTNRGIAIVKYDDCLHFTSMLLDGKNHENND